MREKARKVTELINLNSQQRGGEKEEAAISEEKRAKLPFIYTTSRKSFVITRRILTQLPTQI